MLRTVNDQPTVWDAILPVALLVLPVELGRLDELVDDPVFFVPFFDARIGGPLIPMETYLQMMFLKFRYRLSDAALCREVANSISWQLVLPDPVRDTGGPSDPAEEAHHRVWRCGGRRAQRGLVGQGR